MTVQPLQTTDVDWQSDIASLENAANEAFLNHDLERLGQLFSDELLVNSPINRVNGKKTILQLLGSGVIVSSTIRHELIRRDGDLAIVMGSDAVQNSEAEPVLRRRFTNAWRREGDCWRLYIRHANVITEVRQ